MAGVRWRMAVRALTPVVLRPLTPDKQTSDPFRQMCAASCTSPPQTGT